MSPGFVTSIFSIISITIYVISISTIATINTIVTIDTIIMIRFRGFTVTKAVCGGCHTMVLGVPVQDFQVGL